MPAGISDELLLAYQRELEYLRSAGGEFAARYPRIARRLELSPETCSDPHVERLLESFAFLTARLQRQIDGEFPQFAAAMLELLHPNLIQPVPSISIARFDVDVEQGLPLTGFSIPAHARLFANLGGGQSCHLRTAYPLTLWPIQISEAALESVERYPFLESQGRALAVLRLRLHCQSRSFAELDLKSLRFFINAEPRTAYAIYNLLVGSTSGICLRDVERPEPSYEVHPAARLQLVGLSPEEALLPAPHNVHPGYGLLSDYFVFPEKFLFFDCDLPGIRRPSRTVDLLILLSELPQRLQVSADSFALGCVPVVNLFPRTAEPIRITQRQTEYRLIADQRNERHAEVHSVVRVSAAADSKSPAAVEPFFSFTHPAGGDRHQLFFHVRRAAAKQRDRRGTELFLTFTDLQLNPRQPELRTLYAHTLCTNRDLPMQLAAGAQLMLEEPAPISRIRLLRKPTAPIEPPLSGQGLWLLVSQLSLNHLSLLSGPDAVRKLRECLRLHCREGSGTAEAQISGITNASTRPILRRVAAEAWRGFCQGLEVSLEFDEEQFVGSSALLLSLVLSRFLPQGAAVNSFVEVVARSRQRQGEWKRWPARISDQSLL